MNVVKQLVSLLLVAVLCISVTACGSNSSAEEAPTKASEETKTESSPDKTPEKETVLPDNDRERVPLYVTALVSRGEPDGRRSDPVSLYIEEELNIDLELTGVIDSEYHTQFSAMLAANDLPDIFNISDLNKQFPMLMASENLLCIEPYLKDYAQTTLNDPNGAVMLEAYRSPATSPDGDLYLWGMSKGSWDDGTVPTCGHYIRWDLYKEADYPILESYDEDLLDVLEQLVALEPETDDGQKTYGLGAWFGDGQGWAEWSLTFGLAPQEGYHLTNGSTLAISLVDSSPLESNQLTDPESYFWRTARFYNRANQRGLLDPDSFTQKSDIYEQKLKAGRYMFNVPGWMSVAANHEFDKTEGNLKTFVSLPSIQGNAEERFANMFRGERVYGIFGKTEYPERCVELLDFLSSYEFSRIAWNGLEGGGNWNMEDGVPVPTDAYLEATRDDAFGVETGASVYNHFCGYANGSVDPVTGLSVDLYQFSDKAVERKMNDTILDFCKHYGQESQVDVYRAETEHTDTVNLVTFSEAPDDLKNSINGLNAFVGKNIAKVIAASSDEEFAQLRDEMMEGLQNYQVDEIFDFFYNDAIEQRDTIETLASMIAEG